MTTLNKIHRYCFISTIILSLFNVTILQAKERISPMRVDTKQVKQWNRFADSLYELHNRILKSTVIRTEEEVGGYGGVTGGDYYNEVRYYDRNSGLLLSKVQWELKQPDVIHNIEIFIYDSEGKLIRDYYAGYLPHHRNAPLHTMVNFHGDQDGLKSFRQFDASGERIYEQCSGRHFSEDVELSIEDYELLSPSGEVLNVMATEAYLACFGDLPKRLGKYIDPLVDLPASAEVEVAQDVTRDDYALANDRIRKLSSEIETQLNRAPLYTKRAEEYFHLGDFEKAENDLNLAIESDSKHSQAWFWRGMVRGRQGKLDEAIADLSVFIKRHPSSSLAYTKRGVRYIWKGELKKAEQDLQRAVELNPANAEAHDDLGVLLAQRQKLKEAASHFATTIRLDPSYQKAHHNLATALFLQGQSQAALYSVEHSLQLAPNDRNSLMLKSEILSRLGRNTESALIREQAEFLPEGNWSERFSQP